ncbi:MAG: (S)-ureidoglycine aminohydrolase [Acidobacteriaceae bacterium]
MHNLGHSRSASRRDHLLQTPDTFVRTTLPAIERGCAIVHVSSGAGAGFTQYTVELDAGGTLAAAEHQRFVFVLDGAVDLTSYTSFHSLACGGYVYLPPGSPHTVTATEAARIVVIEKPYQPLAGQAAPALLVGEETNAPASALLDDPDLQVRRLLPDDAGFDFAVNTMTYQPGASLSMVEIHVMEHGLLMLEGAGIYRLGDQWYPVTAGDFIWMAPFCPQWFGALGKRPAKYLIYKDANRHPL